MIGGNVFLNYASNSINYHPTLPEGDYQEADVDYPKGEARSGENRLVYQSNCVIYYTENHYETFELMQF